VGLRIEKRDGDLIVLGRTSGIEAKTPDGFKMFRGRMNKDSKDEFKFRESFGKLLTVGFVRKSNGSSVIVDDASGRDGRMASISSDVTEDMFF